MTTRLNMRRALRRAATLGVCTLALLISGCGKSQSFEKFVAEHRALVIDADEAQAFFSGRTIRTYSEGHGVQVEYHAPDGGAHLWYPGNSRVNSGEWSMKEYYHYLVRSYRRSSAGNKYLVDVKSFSSYWPREKAEKICTEFSPIESNEYPDCILIPDINICYYYGPHSYNPVTKRYLTGPLCGSVHHQISSIVEVVDGDPFRLDVDGTIPFVLDQADATMVELFARARQIRPDRGYPDVAYVVRNRIAIPPWGRPD